jgi:hypothetical protein
MFKLPKRKNLFARPFTPRAHVHLPNVARRVVPLPKSPQAPAKPQPESHWNTTIPSGIKTGGRNY